MERHDAAPPAVFADEELDALTALVTEGREDRRSELGEAELLGCGPAEPDELEAEAESALGVPSKQSMVLERGRQAMCRGTGQTSRLGERSQVERSAAQRGQDVRALVDHPDTT